MDTISPALLLDLKQVLEVMVQQNRMEESEMVDILLRAGLAKLPEGEGWLDEQGARYNFK